MKRATKRLTAALLAAMLISGIQLVAFADDSSSEDETSAVTVVEDTTEDGTETATAISEAINESPNTGVGVSPMAVALLAAACVPVLLKTRK